MFTGCGKWEQDPLAQAQGQLRQGQQKPTDAESPKADQSELLRIFSPDSFGFKEGQENHFTITSKTLEEGFSNSISISNLDDFVDATFDPATGVFQWHPKKGTLSATDPDVKDYVLKVRATAEKTGEKVRTRSKDISLTLSRRGDIPTLSVTLRKDTIREGDMTQLDIEIYDQDAQVAETTWPTIQLGSVASTQSLLGFLSLGGMRSLGKGWFAVSGYIDLQSAEVTSNMDKFGFSVRALSRLLKSSATQNVYATILTSLSEPVTTWTEPLRVVAGENINYQFLIMDPKAETRVTLKQFDALPAEAKASCQTANSTKPSLLACSLLWPTTTTTPDRVYSFSASVVATNTYYGDSASKPKSFQLKVIVSPAPTTTTTTTSTSTTSTTLRSLGVH